MELIAAIGIVLLFLGSLLYLLICIDPNSPGIFGKIHRFVFVALPILMRKILGDRFVNFLGNIVHYIFYTNHPLVQLFYLLVAVGGFIVYALFGFLKLFKDNPEVNSYHSLIGTILAFLSFHSYYQACYFGAGIIHKDNASQYHEKFKDYFDQLLYMKENKCSTCDIIKPARSKHCRVCDICVSRFDHHCVWIRQCVGQKNYKYFLKFIALHAILTCYGSWLGVKALYGIALKLNLFNVQFRYKILLYYIKIRNPVTREIIQGSYLVIFKYLFFSETMFVFITLLCTIMGLTLFLFFLYHLSMVRVDVTTNEKMKISDFRAFFKDDITKMTKQLQIEVEEDKKKKLQDTISSYQQNLAKLNQRNTIGIIKGLKQVFSQSDEVKWKVLRQRRKAMRKNKDKKDKSE